MFYFSPEQIAAIEAGNDNLFTQLKQRSITPDELNTIIGNAGNHDLGLLSNAIFNSELMLRDPEEIGNALENRGLKPDEIISILTSLRFSQLQLKT